MNYNTIISHVNTHFNDFTPTKDIDTVRSCYQYSGLKRELGQSVTTAEAQAAREGRSEPALDRADRRAQQGDVLEYAER